MAQDRILGEQVDIIDISSDMAAEPEAIGNLAKGITDDPGASAALDIDYLRRDGTTNMSGTLTVNSNIVVTGTVDGRDIATDGSTQDTHIADTTLHFTVASINHQSITGAGTNTHAQIDTHLGNTTLHFTEASISHANITNIGGKSHTVIDAHIDDTSLHFSAISGLTDVDTTGATAGQVLTYSNSPAGWFPQTATGGGGGVTNPMTADLDTGGFIIKTADGTTPDSISITGGNSTAGSRENPADITLTAGAADNVQGGTVYLKGGIASANNSGGIELAGADCLYAGSDGGHISLNAGANTTSLLSKGGAVIISSGSGGTGGDINITSGNASIHSGAVAGNINLAGGNGDVSGTSGGSLVLRAGTAGSAGSTPGTFSLSGGQSAGGNAGIITIKGGNNTGGGTGNAGNLNLTGGAATGGGSGSGGNVVLTPGEGPIVGTTQLHYAESTIGQASIQFWNDTDTAHTTGNYVALKAPPSPPANITFVLPELDGANGDVLQTDGSGNLGFSIAPIRTPVYTLATLPVVVEGGMIYVSDATGSSLTGSQCFGNVSGSPTVWIDVTTGAAVA